MSSRIYPYNYAVINETGISHVDKSYFQKNGKEIKEAIANGVAQLDSRLKKGNEDLDNLMSDRTRLRSYLVKNSDVVWGMHGGEKSAALYTKDDISSEEVGEIRQIRRGIFEIQQELERLYLIKEHLKDEQEF